MALRKLREYLDRYGVKYLCLDYSPAYTEGDAARSAQSYAAEMIKVVPVKVGGRVVLVAMPAEEEVNLEVLTRAMGGDVVTLAGEKEMGELIPNCEAGAIPPLGFLFGMPLYADERLREKEYIVFAAGSKGQLVQMKMRDWEAIADPMMIELGEAKRPAGEGEAWTAIPGGDY